MLAVLMSVGSLWPVTALTYAPTSAAIVATTDHRGPAVGAAGTSIPADDAATVPEDGGASVLDVLANDTVVGQPAIELTGGAQHGDATVTDAGVAYAPNLNYCNDGAPVTIPDLPVDEFRYRLSPGGNEATVAVTVRCVDDAPVAVDDTIVGVVNEDASATRLEVLPNDTDIDDGERKVIAVSPLSEKGGTVEVGVGGAHVMYQPKANYCTSSSSLPDRFSYTLNGGASAHVFVRVGCVNDNPVAVDDATTVDEDSGFTTINVLANDVEVDGDGMGVDSIVAPALHGQAEVVPGGTAVRYRPIGNYCSTDSVPAVDTFRYRLTPGEGTAQVDVTVICVDDVPGAVNDNVAVTEDSESTTIAVIDNDNNSDAGPMVVEAVTSAIHGEATVALGGMGVTYTPDRDFCTPLGAAPDTFDYRLNGGSTATVSITVDCIDDAPLAVDDVVSMAANDPRITINVLLNDLDVDGSNQVVAVGAATHGTTGFTPTSVTYEPDAGSCTASSDQPDTFSYTVNGGSAATVAVTVFCPPDAPPEAKNDTIIMAEDAPPTEIDVLDNDLNADGGAMMIKSVTPPTHGTLIRAENGASVVYTPDPNYCNSGDPAPSNESPDSSTYVLTPGDSEATVDVIVTCVDDAPKAVDDAANTLEDAPITLRVLDNDLDSDGGAMSILSVRDPLHGAVDIASEGTELTYRPDPDFCTGSDNPPADDFAYTLAPGHATAIVRVTIVCVDDSPTAVDDTQTVAQNAGATTIDVLRNDTDPDVGPKSIASVTQPANGTVELALGGAGLTYEPHLGYCNSSAGTPSTDDFTYELAPGGADGSVGTVRVTVTCPPGEVPSGPGEPSSPGTTADPGGPGVPAGPPGPVRDPAPDTRLVTKSVISPARKVRFHVRSTVPGSTFQCRLDRQRRFKRCRPHIRLVVSPGKHVLAVRAVGPAGVPDPTPLRVRWVTLGAS
jgi:cadherin-like protein/Big-like domain-containing protein